MANPYLTGVKTITKMFRTRQEPEKYDHMLKPVAVLQALQKSLKSKQIEKVLK